MKVYIAGPMIGYDEFNFPQFFQAERELIGLGHEPLNPAWNNGDNLEEALKNAEEGGRTWEEYMRKDIVYLAQADIICVLKDWYKSKGARLEVKLAKALDIPVMILRDGKLIPRVEVLGIAGYARSGKDTVAKKLMDYGYINMSFAEPIKEAMYMLNPKVAYDMEDLDYQHIIDTYGIDDAKVKYPEVRRLLQVFGTEVGRSMFGEDVWVDMAMDNMPDGAKVVFTDVRYPNEANAIRNFGGEIWWVEREGVGPLNDHPSENSLNEYLFNYRVKNNGSVEELEQKVLDGLNNHLALTVNA